MQMTLAASSFGPAFSQACLLACACTFAMLGAPAAAQDKPAERKALRVCQDPNNLPFSNGKGEGLENRIAELFGQALGRKYSRPGPWLSSVKYSVSSCLVLRQV